MGGVRTGRQPVSGLLPPTDHRVLHGDWQLRPTLQRGWRRFHAISRDGQAILVWADPSTPLHLADDAGVFHPRTPALDFSDFLEADLDRDRDMLVRFDRGDRSSTAIVIQRPMRGGPDHETLLDLPSDRQFRSGRAMQGRWLIFSSVLVGEDSYGTMLDVFDPDDGSLLGSLSVPSYGWELEARSDRVIGLADSIGRTIRVIDPRRPDRLFAIVLEEGCGPSSSIDLSDSGRWLLLGDCEGETHLVDLEASEPTPQPLPWTEDHPAPAFAHGAEQVVWYGDDGHIGRYDLQGGVRDDIRLGDDLPPFFEPAWRKPPTWYADLGLLLYQETYNRVTVTRVEDDLGASAQVIPSYWVEHAELSLEAFDLSESGFSYDVRGEFRVGAQVYGLEGVVVSNRLHYYRPSPYLGVSSYVRPSLSFEAMVTDESGQLVFHLSASNESKHEAIWVAILSDLDGHQAYLTLARP